MVDAGDAFWKSARVPEGTLPQQKVKADLIAGAFAQGGIDAMTLGEGDLSLGVDEVRAIAARYDLPIVLANLECEGGPPFAPARRVERGGVTLGVAGVIDPALAPAGCSAKPAAEALKAAFDGLGAVDVRLVLSHQDKELDRELAEAVPEIDLVVNGHARLTNRAPAALPGDALQLAAGSRGRNVGVATVTLEPGATGFRSGDAALEAKEKLERVEGRLKTVDERLAGADGPLVERLNRQREMYLAEKKRIEAELDAAREARQGPAHNLANELVALDERVADQPAATALLEAAKARLAQVEAGLPAEPQAEAGSRPYAGSAVCQGCHPGPFAQWSSTPHATAWASLEAQNRHMDRECFSCHATGVGEPGGPSAPAAVGDLKNVGCESCHGPAREHVANPAVAKLVGVPSVELCTGCHDGVKDEGRFEPATYLPQVAHADEAGARP